MHLLGAVLVVLGAWMVLSVPVALVMGRFLRVANNRCAHPGLPQAPRDWFRSTAA